jgi:putative glutamine amidotransferase
MLPIVGIACCARSYGTELHHTVPARYAAALIGGAGVIPILIPPTGQVALELLRSLHGLLLSGSPSNASLALWCGGRPNARLP